MDEKMYMISYCMIFASHLNLKMERIVIYRSFQQNQEELGLNQDLNHLKERMLQYVDSVTLNQLKDAGIKVHEI